MLVSGRVLLRLKQSIKVPKGALYKIISWHLRKSVVKLTCTYIQCITHVYIRIIFT